MKGPGQNPRKPADDKQPARRESGDSQSQNFDQPTMRQPAESATELAVEELAAEFLERCQKGQHPSIEEYAAKFPRLAVEIRDLFPAMVAMERLKADKSAMVPRGVAGGLTVSQLGDFQIIREIGRGGMGIVYEAEQLSLRRRVAVKVLPKQALLNPKHAARFQREARTAANLHHANIVPVYGAGEAEGFHYIVMQYISGVGLDKILARLSKTGAKADLTPSALGSLFGNAAVNRSARMQAARAARGKQQPESVAATYWQTVAWIGLQVSRALEYAHELGVLHRDIKPGNLLLDEQGIVVVADFGLAKQTEQSDVSGTGEILGTLGYMAPEQISGEADRRSDIYSLGLTLYEFLTLRSAFPGTNNSELVHMKTQTELGSPRKRNPRIPLDLETIVLKAVSRETAHRYQSAGAMAEDLQRFLEDRAILARRIRPWEQFARWCRRNPSVAVLSGVSIGLLMTVAAVAGIGYTRTKAALLEKSREEEKAQEQSARAEQNLALSLEVLDELYLQFAPDKLVETTPVTVVGTGGVSVSVPTQSSLSPETAAMLEKILSFYDKFATQNGDNARLKGEAARANRRVGDIHARLGEVPQASQAYERAISKYAQLRDSLSDSDYRLETARTRNALGKLQRTAGDDAASRKSHLAAMEILNLPAATASSPELRFELARTYFLLARRPPVGPETAPGERPGPQSHGEGGPPGPFRAGRPGFPPQFGEGPPDFRRPPPGLPGKGPPPRGAPGGERPDDEGPDGNRPGPEGPERERPRPADSARAGSAKGAARPDQQPPGPPPEVTREVTKHCDLAVALLNQLRKDYPGRPEYRHLLALCYREYPPQEDSSKTEKAIELLEELSKEFPKVADYRHELAQTYANVDVRDALNAVENRTEILKKFERALAISEALVREHPEIPEYSAALAELYLRIGAVHSHASIRAVGSARTNLLQEAESNFRKAVERQSDLVDRYPAVLGQLVWLGRMQQQLARTLLRLGQSVEARTLIESSIRKLETSLEKYPQYEVLNMSLFENYQVLAELQKDLGENKAASEARERAAQYREKFKPPTRPAADVQR